MHSMIHTAHNPVDLVTDIVYSFYKPVNVLCSPFKPTKMRKISAQLLVKYTRATPNKIITHIKRIIKVPGVIL